MDKSILAQHKSLCLAFFLGSFLRYLRWLGGGVAERVQGLTVLGDGRSAWAPVHIHRDTGEVQLWLCKKSLPLNNRHLPRAEQHVCCQQMKFTRAEEG